MMHGVKYNPTNETYGVWFFGKLLMTNKSKMRCDKAFKASEKLLAAGKTIEEIQSHASP
jgi:hypothetical protein